MKKRLPVLQKRLFFNRNVNLGNPEIHIRFVEIELKVPLFSYSLTKILRKASRRLLGRPRSPKPPSRGPLVAPNTLPGRCRNGSKTLPIRFLDAPKHSQEGSTQPLSGSRPAAAALKPPQAAPRAPRAAPAAMFPAPLAPPTLEKRPKTASRRFLDATRRLPDAPKTPSCWFLMQFYSALQRTSGCPQHASWALPKRF